MMLAYGTGRSADIPAIFAQAKALVDAYEDVSAIDYDWVMNWMARKITQKIGGLYPCHLEWGTLRLLPPDSGRGIG